MAENGNGWRSVFVNPATWIFLVGLIAHGAILWKSNEDTRKDVYELRQVVISVLVQNAKGEAEREAIRDRLRHLESRHGVTP